MLSHSQYLEPTPTITSPRSKCEILWESIVFHTQSGRLALLLLVPSSPPKILGLSLVLMKRAQGHAARIPGEESEGMLSQDGGKYGNNLLG